MSLSGRSIFTITFQSTEGDNVVLITDPDVRPLIERARASPQGVSMAEAAFIRTFIAAVDDMQRVGAKMSAGTVQ